MRYVWPRCHGSPSADVAAAEQAEQQTRPKLGLFTTLPIYWGEDGDIPSLLNGESDPDWVRTELERYFDLVLLDTLEADALDGLDRVLLAQPRPLAPSENVAFDNFLAGGGTAIIMADPMVTRHSEYAIGDRRRPQDVALLSPILSRLGARLEYDEEQDEGDRMVTSGEIVIPVNQSGRFVSTPSDVSPTGCAIEGEVALQARCKRGDGIAHLFADTAVLDWEGDLNLVPALQRDALRALLAPLRPEVAR